MRCHTSPFFKLLRHNAKSASILIFFTLMLSLLLSASLLRQDFNLDGCYHVYLDVGTNVGIQIRKLYEPEKYPNASIHKFFDEHFKRNIVSSSRHICAIGFEPNPRHVSILQNLESTYQKCGWNVQILTKSAVSTKEGIATFYSDNDLENLEWGGSIIEPHVEEPKEVKSPESVNLVHLSKFIQDIISSRKLPQLDPEVYGPPQVLMKLDIGSPHLLAKMDLAKAWIRTRLP